jgi:ATP-dependent Lhr-like helicase
VSGFDRLSGALQYEIVNTLGWTALRPVQEQTIEAVLEGDNAVVLAPTAGGKTEAAFFPLFSRMIEEDWRPVSVVYLSPIRALLNNQEERVQRLAAMVGRRAFKWHGDVGASARRAFLEDPADVLLITPESIEAMLMSPKVATAEVFRGLRAVIVDEVHAFADDDRGGHLAALVERLTRYSGRDVQRLGLSATVGNPGEILRWIAGSSERAGTVIDPGGAARGARVELDYVGSLENAALAIRALHPGKKRLVFTESRAQTEALGQRLDELGVLAYVIHGSLAVSSRRDAERAFAEGRDCVIVSTSAMELGIDVGDLDHVLQIDAPGTVASFLQRMGRTGRRPGQVPNLTFLCVKESRLLQAAALIRLWRDGFVEDVRPSRRAAHLLAHQIMSLGIQHGGVARQDIRGWLDGTTNFADLEESALDELVDHMVAKEILTDDQGRLWLGEKGERSYGRANFRALYAVFESPRMIRVEYARQEIGQVEATFLTALDEGEDLGSFTLGGRPWQIVDIDWRKGRCVVKPAPHGKAPRWASNPRWLSYELCQAMESLVLDDVVDDEWSQRATERLGHIRATYAFLEDLPDGLVDSGEDEVTWHNFAGGAANVLLAKMLEADIGGRVVARNTSLSFRGEAAKSLIGIREALDGLTAANRPRWEDSLRFAPDASRSRFSKFQPCLPDRMARDIMVERLVDFAAARIVLGLDPTPPEERPPVAYARPRRPIVWIRTAQELDALVAGLAEERLVALDVETTLTDQSLCLVQLGTAEANYLVDPFALGDLEPLRRVLEAAGVEKIIHNAQFEKRVLGKLGFDIVNIYDTLSVSRRLRGKLGAGHSLLAVVRRELDLIIDKHCQTSDWRRRPLSEAQERYAALDVEVLVDLAAAFRRLQPELPL